MVQVSPSACASCLVRGRFQASRIARKGGWPSLTVIDMQIQNLCRQIRLREGGIENGCEVGQTVGIGSGKKDLVQTGDAGGPRNRRPGGGEGGGARGSRGGGLAGYLAVMRPDRRQRARKGKRGKTNQSSHACMVGQSRAGSSFRACPFFGLPTPAHFFDSDGILSFVIVVHCIYPLEGPATMAIYSVYHQQWC